MPHDTTDTESGGWSPMQIIGALLCTGLLIFAAIKLWTIQSRIDLAERNIDKVYSLGTNSQAKAELAIATAEEASSSASTAKMISMITASDGDFPPIGNKEVPMSEEEKAARRLAAAKKQAAADAAEQFKKLSLRADTHDEMFKTVEGMITNLATETRGSIANTSNSLATALFETTFRMNTETEGKIRLALKNTATRADLDALNKSAKDLKSEQLDANLMLATLGDKVASMSNRLAAVQTAGIKVSKPQKAKGTNVVAVKAGEIDKDEEQIVSGAITRTGRPVVKKGWFRRESVTVTYVVTLNAPNGTDIDLGEATFQAFENANGGIMSDLAKVSEKDTVRLARLSKELTSKFGDFIKKENKLPKEVKFVGAQAKATPPASNP